MKSSELDQLINVSTTIQHTKRHLVDAISLLTNAQVINVDECRRLAAIIAGM